MSNVMEKYLLVLAKGENIHHLQSIYPFQDYTGIDILG